MISRTVRLQLLALALVAIIGVGYTGFRYAGLDRIFGATTYPVTVQLVDSGGIFTGADVTYRGVSVGRVGPLTLTASGVDVQLDIDNSAPEIPADTSAAIRNLSAIGEQYVDLQPGPEGGATLAAGAVVPVERTQTPVGVEDLVVNLDDFVKTVPLDSLRTVVNEVGDGFANTAQPLRQLLDTTSQFSQAGIDALPQTTSLIRDSRPVLATQNEVAPQFKEFSASLAQVADQLEESDPDIRRIVEDGPEAADQISGLLRESGPGLGESIANLRQVSELLEPRQAGLRQLLVTYPGLVAVAPYVVPGDGTAHLGLVVNINNPPVCTRGYEGTPRRSAQDVSEVAVNSGAYCAEPPGSATNVRGMQNLPRAETPMPPADAGDTPAPPPAAGPDPSTGASPASVPSLVTDPAQILGRFLTAVPPQPEEVAPMSVPTDERPQESPPAPEHSPGRLAGALPIASVVAAVLALVFGALWLVALNSDSVTVASDRDAVLRDARQAVLNLNTLDYHDAGGGLDLWIQSSTGSVRDEFQKNRDAYAALVTQQKRTTSATIADAAVGELDPRAGVARVLVGVDVTVTPEGRQPTVTRQRIEAEMTETPDGWKVSALDPLLTPGAGG